MAQPYLDSAGNVNSAVANDVANFQQALRQRAIVPAAPAVLAAAGTVLAADAVTGMPNTGSAF